jgi:hypothetical protein
LTQTIRMSGGPFPVVEDEFQAKAAGRPENGPWNILMTFTAETGYFRDCLTTGITFV